jgi:hypothetical protein
LASSAPSLFDRPAGPSPQPHLQHSHARVGQHCTASTIHSPLISRPERPGHRTYEHMLSPLQHSRRSGNITCTEERFRRRNNFWRGTCKTLPSLPHHPLCLSLTRAGGPRSTLPSLAAAQNMHNTVSIIHLPRLASVGRIFSWSHKEKKRIL